jgi:ubiquinone/menaquinone biosynthesis C-methylase UbiE
MTNQAKFWDKVADKYSKQPIADEEKYQKKLKLTQDLFKPDMHVLEFGCGTGSTALIHAPHVKHILATDFSPEMISIAQKKRDEQGINNVTFECADINDINIPEQSLDVVLGLSILHLLENKEDTIAKVYKMLKPEGFFVTSTVCIESKILIFKILGPIGRFLRIMPLFKAFKAKELEENLRQAGFQINHNWRPEKSMSVFIIAQKPN